MKHIIWTSDVDYDDWKTDLQAMYPEEEGYTEDDWIRLMYETNNDYLDDEKANLNKELGRDIVIIASLGLWNGRKNGYKEVGSNLNEIFSSTCGDSVTWYVENEEVKCEDIHHDGTNHYTYRLLKEDVDMDEFDECFFKESVSAAVSKYTEPLGKYVADIYGFELKEA